MKEFFNKYKFVIIFLVCLVVGFVLINLFSSAYASTNNNVISKLGEKLDKEVFAKLLEDTEGEDDGSNSGDQTPEESNPDSDTNPETPPNNGNGSNTGDGNNGEADSPGDGENNPGTDNGDDTGSTTPSDSEFTIAVKQSLSTSYSSDLLAIKIGDTINYQITVNNSSGANATVVIDAGIPKNTTYNLNSASVNGSAINSENINTTSDTITFSNITAATNNTIITYSVLVNKDLSDTSNYVFDNVCQIKSINNTNVTASTQIKSNAVLAYTGGLVLNTPNPEAVKAEASQSTKNYKIIFTPKTGTSLNSSNFNYYRVINGELYTLGSLDADNTLVSNNDGSSTLIFNAPVPSTIIFPDIPDGTSYQVDGGSSGTLKVGVPVVLTNGTAPESSTPGPTTPPNLSLVLSQSGQINGTYSTAFLNASSLQNVYYNLVVTNNSTTDAQNVGITSIISPTSLNTQFTITNGTTTAVQGNVSGNSISWTVNIPAGKNITLSYAVAVPSTINTYWSNTASVTTQVSTNSSKVSNQVLAANGGFIINSVGQGSYLNSLTPVTYNLRLIYGANSTPITNLTFINTSNLQTVNVAITNTVNPDGTLSTGSGTIAIPITANYLTVGIGTNDYMILAPSTNTLNISINQSGDPSKVKQFNYAYITVSDETKPIMKTPVNIIGQKQVLPQIANYSLSNDEFNFKITPGNNPTSDPVGTKTVSNLANGTIPLFSNVIYTAEGTYNYTISEVIPTNPSENFEYDTTIYQVKIVVTNNNGILEAVTTITNNSGTQVNQIVFTNTLDDSYEPPADTGDVLFTKEQSINGSIPTDSSESVENGDRVTYNLTVTNNTALAIDEVVITDVVPEGLVLVEDSVEDGDIQGDVITWVIQYIEAGDTMTFSFDTVADFDSPSAISNTATLSYEDSLENLYSNTVYLNPVTEEMPLEDISFEIYQSLNNSEYTTDYITAYPGDTVNYMIVLENNGDTDLEDLIVTDTISLGFSLVLDSVSNNGKVEDRTIIWDIDTLEAGENLELTFNVLVEENSEVGRLLYNQAYLSLPDQENILSTNQAQIINPDNDNTDSGNNEPSDLNPMTPPTNNSPNQNMTNQGSTTTTTTTTTTTIKNITQQNTSPKTGVDSTLYIWIAVLVIAIIGLAVLLYMQKKKK